MYRTKSNFVADILESTKGETIKAVVILGLVDSTYGGPDPRDTEELKEVLRKPISWDRAKQLLNYEYDASYGGIDCHDVVIYTDKSIYYLHDYDGSTWLRSVYIDPSNYAESKEENTNARQS